MHLKECEEPNEDRPNITGEINVNIDSKSIHHTFEYEYTVKIRSNLDHHTSLLKLAEKLKYESIHLAIFAIKKINQ